MLSASALIVVISVASYQVSADDIKPSFPEPQVRSYDKYPKYQHKTGEFAREDYVEFEYDVQQAIWDAVNAAKLDEHGDHEHIDYSEFSRYITTFYNKRMNPAKADENEHLEDQHKRALFRIYDKDHNDQLSMKEAVVGFLQHQEFFFYDVDFNGKLSKAELISLHDSPHRVAAGKYALSANIDFLEMYQRMLSHSKLKVGWEETMGVVPATSG